MQGYEQFYEPIGVIGFERCFPAQYFEMRRTIVSAYRYQKIAVVTGYQVELPVMQRAMQCETENVQEVGCRFLGELCHIDTGHFAISNTERAASIQASF
jgi:hypothetical protein